MSEIHVTENQVRVEGTPSAVEPKNKNKKTGTGGENEKKLKTRCYYTDYVNHAIRFYLSTPEVLQMDGKRRADVDNWCSVQAVLHCMTDADRSVLEEVFRLNYRVQDGVKQYCETHSVNELTVWKIITKASAAIAKRRGLI